MTQSEQIQVTLAGDDGSVRRGTAREMSISAARFYIYTNAASDLVGFSNVIDQEKMHDADRVLRVNADGAVEVLKDRDGRAPRVLLEKLK